MDKALAFIVEDSSILAIFFAKVLADAEYEVEIMTDGQEALTRLEGLEGTVPDLILLDLNIPNVSGEKVLARIRSDKRFTDTRILVTSGNATRAGQLRDKDALILHKPVDYHQLRQLSAILHPFYQSTHIFPSG